MLVKSNLIELDISRNSIGLEGLKYIEQSLDIGESKL